MDKIFLEKPLLQHKAEYEIMMEEWINYGGRIHPGALKNYYNNNPLNKVTYEKWLKWIEDDRHIETCPKGTVPQDLYFLVNENKVILGGITIRHYLDEKYTKNGGHFGVGIRPSERLKGYASKMIELALIIAKNEYGIKKILYTCDKDNIGSAKAIQNNGGRFLDEIIEDDGNTIQRYSIEL
jgi:predicted acetyltransferase